MRIKGHRTLRFLDMRRAMIRAASMPPMTAAVGTTTRSDLAIVQCFLFVSRIHSI